MQRLAPAFRRGLFYFRDAKQVRWPVLGLLLPHFVSVRRRWRTRFFQSIWPISHFLPFHGPRVEYHRGKRRLH